MSDFCIFNDYSIPIDRENAEELCRAFLRTVHEMKKRLNIKIVKCKNPEISWYDLPAIKSGNSVDPLGDFFKGIKRGEFKDLWSSFLSLSTRGYWSNDELLEIGRDKDCISFARETNKPLLSFRVDCCDKYAGVRILSSPENVVEEWKNKCMSMALTSWGTLFPNLEFAENTQTIKFENLSCDVRLRFIKKIFIPFQLFAEKLKSDQGLFSFSIPCIKEHTIIGNISVESDSVRKNENLNKYRFFRGKSIFPTYFPFHIKENDQTGPIRIYIYWDERSLKVYFAITRHLPTQRY